MEELLAELDGVLVFLDDIVIGGRNSEEHEARLRAVLKRISDDGLRLNKGKCKFGVPQVTFLGYQVDRKGIHPTKDKVLAIKTAPEPEDKQRLQFFLGLLNFYGRFLKGGAHVLEPLHRLLDNGAAWKWGREEATAFRQAKDLLQSSAVLAHYDVALPLVLACDASSYGLGFVMSHVSPSGQESPVAFGSRTMTQAERNYSQMDREALAVIARE